MSVVTLTVKTVILSVFHITFPQGLKEKGSYNDVNANF